MDSESVVGFAIAVDDERLVIMIGVDGEDASSWGRISSLVG